MNGIQFNSETVLEIRTVNIYKSRNTWKHFASGGSIEKKKNKLECGQNKQNKIK